MAMYGYVYIAIDVLTCMFAFMNICKIRIILIPCRFCNKYKFPKWRKQVGISRAICCCCCSSSMQHFENTCEMKMAQFKINKEYAAKYKKAKERQELEKCKIRYPLIE